MRSSTASPAARFAPILAVASLLAAGPSEAGLRVLASDDRGITLRLDVPALEVSAPDPTGRSTVEAPGLESAGIPGRPRLPFASALIALPPGARPVARVVEGGPEEARQARLELMLQPGYRYDGSALGYAPTLEDVPTPTDGAWPAATVEVGEPFLLRHVRVATVRIQPVRYDEGSATLWTRSTLTVRVDFQGAVVSGRALAPEPDLYWDPVLREAILNADRAAAWREPRNLARPLAEQLERIGAAKAPATEARDHFGAFGAAPFDEDEPEVRVQLDTTGVYALEYDQLALQGFPTAVPDTEVSVHRHEFVENASPPYTTIELPIEVDDRDADGIFGPGDRILLFVQSWAARSRASNAQRAWGDGEVVYATRVRGRDGLRMNQRPGWLDLPLTPLASYPLSLRWEKNLYYMSAYYVPAGADTNVDQFHWTELLQFAFPDSFTFDVADLDTTHAASVAVTWQGRKQNNHTTWAHIRNGNRQFTSVVDSLVWSGRGSRTATQNMFGSAFTNGRNVLRSWGMTSPTENQIVNVGFNYFDTAFWRRYRAVAGYLPCNSGDASGTYQIDASQFATREIRVYDVTDSLNPVRLALNDTLIVKIGPRYTARFQDDSPTGARRQYVAFDRPRALAPERYGAVPYPRRALYAEGAGDYLLIVPEVFAAAAESLADLRERQGLRVVRAPLEVVNDEFNGGRRSSYALRRFLRYAYLNWNARFVLLMGDGSEDPQNFLGTSGLDWIPTQKVPGPVGVSDGASTLNEPIPSDAWLVWALDRPMFAPFLPDMFIGRLPVNSVQQTKDVVRKVVAYDTVAPTATDELWRRSMLLLADDQYSTTSFFGSSPPGGPTYCRRPYEVVFRDISRLCAQMVTDSAGLKQSDVEVFDLHVELRNEPYTVSGGDTCRVSWNETQSRAHLTITPKILQRLNAGRLWWNYQGHANQYVLAHEDIWVNRGANDDHVFLVNQGRPFFFSAFSCHPNGFAVTQENTSNRGPAIGEELVVHPNGGSIASWASTGFEILPSSASTHLNVHLARALFARPPHDEFLGDRGARVVLGEAISLALVNNDDSVLFGLEKDVGISYTLLGDPASRMWIGPSQFVVTANGQPVTSGQAVRLLSVGDTLRLEADLVSNVSIASVALERTDASGTVVIPLTDYTLTPAIPDTAAAGLGGRRFHLVYRTTLDVGSYRYTIRVVDRYGVTSVFDVVFEFLTTLRSSGVPLAPRDFVSPDAALSLIVVSPGTLTAGDFTLTVDGNTQGFTATALDTTSRRWELTWTHLPYATGPHRTVLTVSTVIVTHDFQVDSRLRLDNAMAFPNPFEDDLGTNFSFYLVGGAPVDVMVRVFTVSGRMVYERVERGLLPVYHQLHWDGRDAEGQKLGNGVYLFRLIARDGKSQVVHEGRLVKLRKPRRADDTGS